MDGLRQLAKAPAVGWNAAVPSPAQSLNCVYTSVDAGQPLNITLVDPPASANSQAEDSGVPAGFLILPGVARLLLVLESIDFFRALGGVEVASPTDVPDGYLTVVSAAFGGLWAGIPAHYLKSERYVRMRIGVFLAIREVLEDRGFRRLVSQVQWQGRIFLSLFLAMPSEIGCEWLQSSAKCCRAARGKCLISLDVA